ncbi:hypothetical protein GCM10025864_03180 [Luteimicrobium album]|uniref:Extracellular solute-binding protein n=1 Tax=Luteimicrobium album TaxID=1054550 RepID=A0ABQ6HY00_9MICO|nr:extracellular solute-binding protein [Luteimicrobium album]GMA22559.1 hypothetical protein GCM10025864_03180 [Luteimicrobium album]
MKRTRALVAVAVTAAVVALAACSPADDSDGGDGSGGKTTLTYWDFIDPTQDNARSEALKENVAAFEKANPTIDVKLEVVSFGDMLSRLPQAAAAGQTPDVIKMYSPMLPQLADAGVYQALPDDYKQITDWLRPISAFTDAKKAQIAVPYEYRTCSLVYNKKILSKIGAKVPTTWDQVVDVAGKAAKAGYVGFGAGFSEEDNSSLISELFDCFMSELDVPVSTDGKASFAVPKAEEFSQFLINLKQAGGLGKSVVSDQYTNVTDGLSNGTTAMAVIGTHRIQTVQSVNKDVDWAPCPRRRTGAPRAPRSAGRWGSGRAASTRTPPGSSSST